ncbi:cytochrome P450 [Aspergillus granulosus]|uniref:Cytochrome P450 n=1 Tax=Aspergillus granulosus TaxID=176169 RepID=A0ABR4GWY2_9EURO
MAQLLTLVKENPILSAGIALCGHFALSFIRKGYAIRKKFHGLPGPPHSWLWGHIPILLSLLKEVPTRVAPLYYADLIRQKYDLGDVYYFDLWPIGMEFMMIVDADVTNQLIVKENVPKNSILKLFMRFLVGSPDNLLSGDGHGWLKLRRIFNPGFASSHLNTLIPAIVEEGKVFCSILEKHATDHEVFRLEEAATLLTIDVIGRAILDTRLHSQVKSNELATAIVDQVAWIPQARPDRPWEIVNPVFLVMMWWNNRKMDAYISEILEQRLSTREAREKAKNVMDLAFEAYLSERGEDRLSTTKMDAQFKKDAICQVKTFMFAGHDTVSGTLCYAWYLLNKNPEKMAKIRAEHESIFGADVDEAIEIIQSRPNILNKLEYTLAVLKETLRLFPPASTVREGSASILVKDPRTGISLPTEGFAVSPTTIGMHRHPRYFPDPHTFIPERFLSTGNGLSASSSPAYLPFSKGPRICIGQELAMIEMKILLVMTVRRFDIRAAFEDLHLLKGDGAVWESDSSGIQSVYGDEAYQVMMGSAKPREGMPARVTIRS